MSESPPPTRIVFMGTAPIGVPSFEALAAADGFEIVGVVTQPDRPRGRGRRTTPPAIKEEAVRLGIEPVLQPAKMRDPAVVEELRSLRPDLIVVIAFGRILRANVLEIPPLGCVNVHASLLPRHRGAAPIAWCLLAGDRETGVTTMLMDESMDTGDILEQAVIPIEETDDAITIAARLAALAPATLLSSLGGLRDGSIRPRPQDHARATLAPKLAKQDGAIDWSESAEAIVRRVRAMAGWPAAFTCVEEGDTPSLLKIWSARARAGGKAEESPGRILAVGPAGIEVACGDGVVVLGDVQPAGKRRMPAVDFARGHALSEDARLRACPSAPSAADGPRLPLTDPVCR